MFLWWNEEKEPRCVKARERYDDNKEREKRAKSICSDFFWEDGLGLGLMIVYNFLWLTSAVSLCIQVDLIFVPFFFWAKISKWCIHSWLYFHLMVVLYAPTSWTNLSTKPQSSSPLYLLGFFGGKEGKSSLLSLQAFFTTSLWYLLPGWSPMNFGPFVQIMQRSEN